MAYDKQTWQTGDIITAPKLNHMEDGIESAPGYHVETQTVTIIPQQSVTTVDDEGSNYGSITLTNMEGLTEAPESLQVVFNGVNYNCPRDEETPSYGAHWDDSLNDGEGGMDWSEYPFSILLSDQTMGEITTESAGTYTISATISKESLIVSEDFAKARGYSVDNGVVTVTSDFTSAVQTAQKYPVICTVGSDWSHPSWKVIQMRENGMVHACSYNDLLPLYQKGLLIISGYVIQEMLIVNNSYIINLLRYESNTLRIYNFSANSATGILNYEALD